ncbi:MAG: exodeoxyribonuclease V subunit gamma [Mariprofundales bacterium]|nr:exodeoxyribonuclease V subunit gamma [Mariprofundales bacterium]
MRLIRSNQVGALKDSLALQLAEHPLASPFAVETVIVASAPMGRWLGLKLAESNGIDCNSHYSLPATWVWQLVAAAVAEVPAQDPLARDAAAWRLFRLLPDHLEAVEFQPLRHYLAHDSHGLRRWQLCQRIADILDRYQYYRPQMIRDWSAGQGTGWQPLLWRALLADISGQLHRVAAIDRLLAGLRQGDRALLLTLPQRLSVFALPTMPPLLLQVLQAVARFGEVTLYQLAPTAHYWADLRSSKTQAKAQLADLAAAEHLEVGHELLASWGRQGQQFQDLLLAGEEMEEAACFSEQWPATLLGNLQRDLFMLNADRAEGDADGSFADESLELHCCHSALRECQVLHDALLARLDGDPSLKPEDIVVLVPDIGRYAPYIGAVFRRDAARPFLPWNLSATTTDAHPPLIRALLDLLALPQSRFACSEILSYLDLPQIAAKFHLDGEDSAVIRALLAQLHVHWGIDGAHRGALGLPEWSAHSWHAAEERLMAGFAFGEEIIGEAAVEEVAGETAASPLWQGIAPLPLEESSAAMMADLWVLLQRLDYWRHTLAQPRSASAWQLLLGAMMDDLFDPYIEDDGAQQRVRDLLAELTDLAGEEPLSLQLLRTWLEGALSRGGGAAYPFSGGVSFCDLHAVSALPFRHVCLLGMQDAAFPAREQRLEFDLMDHQPQPGDPHRGQADRYRMLEALLCARDGLYISYTGRSMRDNSACQPSVLVRELLDLLAQDYGDKVAKAVIHEHPMQPFSAENYCVAPHLSRRDHRSFDTYWSAVANAIADAEQQVGRGSWPDAMLPEFEGNGDAVALERLRRFVGHPIRYFFNQRLGIYLQEASDFDDDEPFALDGLISWQVRQRLLEGGLQGESRERATRDALKAEGVLPCGLSGEQLLEDEVEKLAAMRRHLAPYGERQSETVTVDCLCEVSGAMVRICGQVRGFYPGCGLLHYSASKFSGKTLLPAWIAHLALCATEQFKEGEQTVLVCSDKAFTLALVDLRQAKAELANYLASYRQGMCQPLPVFPCASWAWIQGSDGAKALSAARAAWYGGSYASGDIDDAYIALAMRGVDAPPFEETAFAQRTQQWYGGAQQYLTPRKEAG